jgi:transposase
MSATMSVRQINPFKLRQFVKAIGVLAKNDRLDARIASFVAVRGRHRRLNGSRRWLPVRRQLSQAKIGVRRTILAQLRFESGQERAFRRCRLDVRFAGKRTRLGRFMSTRS